MKSTIPRNDLLQALASAAQVADQKNTLNPIISNVLLEFAHEQLTVSATDLSNAISTTCPCETTNPTPVAVGARALYDRIKALPDGCAVTVSFEDTTLTIKSGERSYKLNTLNALDFPRIHAPSGTPIHVKAAIIRELIDATIYAASQDATRQHLHGAKLILNGSAKMVTTDGHRLALTELAYVGDPVDILLPLKFVSTLKRLVEKRDDSIELWQTQDRVFVRVGESVASTVLSGAQFPPYGQVIPKRSQKTIRASAKDLIAASRAAELGANHVTHCVTYQSADGSVLLTAQAPDCGEATDRVPAETTEEFRFSASSQYMVQALSATPEDEVIISQMDELDPILIESGTYTAVVMPMRA